MAKAVCRARGDPWAQRGHVENRYTLPVRRTTNSGDATIDLDGTQTTVVKTIRTLVDGAVESAVAVTNAEYAVTLTPAPGAAGAPVSGRLTVEVRSTTCAPAEARAGASWWWCRRVWWRRSAGAMRGDVVRPDQHEHIGRLEVGHRHRGRWHRQWAGPG